MSKAKTSSLNIARAKAALSVFPELAAEMVRLKVDLIVTRGTPAALAAKNATATIPIVMAAIGEPVGTGMVLSLAQPGGNVTGLSAFVNELAAKRIEIMREVVPKILRMAMIDNMGNVSVPPQWDEIKRATLAFGIQPQLYDVRRPEDIGPAFDAAIAQQVDALTVENDSVFIASRPRGARRQTSSPSNLRHAGVCRGWRPVVLRSALSRSLSPHRELRG
jgi:putative ABC transport system substrate-binding protein